MTLSSSMTFSRHTIISGLFGDSGVHGISGIDVEADEELVSFCTLRSRYDCAEPQATFLLCSRGGHLFAGVGQGGCLSPPQFATVWARLCVTGDPRRGSSARMTLRRRSMIHALCVTVRRHKSAVIDGDTVGQTVTSSIDGSVRRK